jgi:hypothetical protein
MGPVLQSSNLFVNQVPQSVAANGSEEVIVPLKTASPVISR